MDSASPQPAAEPTGPDPAAAPPVPRQPSSDEQWRQGLSHTQVSAQVAWGMIAVFIALIVGVPLLQVVVELHQHRRPGVLAFLDWRRFPTRGDLKQYEDALAQDSRPAKLARPMVQETLLTWGHFASAQVTVGVWPHDEHAASTGAEQLPGEGLPGAELPGGPWLFYRPGVDSVMGRGFLDPAVLRKRRAASHEAAQTTIPAPDPRPAIVEFHHWLAAQGIHLVLLPIPDKAGAQALDLSGASSSQAVPPRNVSWDTFIRQMREKGVDVLDVTPATLRPGEVRYLRRDTHWTPDYMDATARVLAEHVRNHLSLRPSALRLRLEEEGSVELPVQPGEGADHAYQRPHPNPHPEGEGVVSTTTPPASGTMSLSENEISNVGDLAEMLHLNPQTYLLPEQTVTIQRVLAAPKLPVRSDATSPVLLLGDSFTNIYSAHAMGWGQGGGLAEHLAYHLGRSVEWIARNDSGAYATREMLYSQLLRNPARLAGKKVVIWEFAARELSLGDWKQLDWPAPRPAMPPTIGQ